MEAFQPSINTSIGREVGFLKSKILSQSSIHK
jgi:hypothetical protein